MSGRVDGLHTEIRGLCDRLTAMEQRQSRPDAPFDLSDVAKELARLRGSLKSRGTEMQSAIKRLSSGQQKGILSVLTFMGSLIDMI